MSLRTALALGLLILTGCEAPPGGPPRLPTTFRLEAAPSLAAPAPGAPVQTREGTDGFVLPPQAASPAPTSAPAGGGPGGAATTEGRVLDAFGVPLKGARVLFANGRDATTDADGRFSLPSGASGPVAVSKPGYVTSLVHGNAVPASLHMRPESGPSEPFDPRHYTVTGTVTWPDADHVGGIVYYQDSLESLCNPVPLGADGSFSLDVTTRRPGTPTGIVLVAAGNGAGQALLGLSTPFTPPDREPLALSMHLADQPVSFSAADQPSTTPLVRSHVEIRQAGCPPMVLEGTPALKGLFSMPAAGLLPGETRVVVETTSEAGDAASRLAMPVSGGAAHGRLLAIPGAAYDAGRRKLVWAEVPGATGYRVEARPLGAGQPAWEAWLPAGNEVLLPDTPWLQPGLAEVRLEVVDAPGLDTYAVAAGPRRLRIAPWLDAGHHRVASTRLAI